MYKLEERYDTFVHEYGKDKDNDEGIEVSGRKQLIGRRFVLSFVEGLRIWEKGITDYRNEQKEISEPLEVRVMIFCLILIFLHINKGTYLAKLYKRTPIVMTIAMNILCFPSFKWAWAVFFNLEKKDPIKTTKRNLIFRPITWTGYEMYNKQ